jgi:hypothetical protein
LLRFSEGKDCGDDKKQYCHRYIEVRLLQIKNEDAESKAYEAYKQMSNELTRIAKGDSLEIRAEKKKNRADLWAKYDERGLKFRTISH